MAVIDKKKLIENYQYHKLSPSARVLLDSFAKCTNPEGEGSPTWDGLMYFSGIKGKDTLVKCREQLKTMGLISWQKTWSSREVDGKKLPRARLTYQITENILLKKSPPTKDKQTNNSGVQSMPMESMSSGKEGANSLGVNNIGVNNYQPSAGSIQIKNEKNQSRSLEVSSFGENLKSSASVTIKEKVATAIAFEDSNIGAFPPLVDEGTSWREAAYLIAEYLNYNPEGDGEWFGFFKEVYRKGQQGHINESAYYTRSSLGDEKVRDFRKIFFDNLHTNVNYEIKKEI